METITLDWNEYINKAVEVVEEGCVLLENKNECLPLKKGTKVAVFGRCQHHYYKSGTGSGGMVNVSKVYDIVEGLKATKNVIIDSELEALYAEWELENPFEFGTGWGNEPWSQKEMPISKETAFHFAQNNDIALVIIGRTAGEDKDNLNEPGSWLLTETEESLLQTLRETFAKICVVLNCGNIIDMSFVQKYNIDSVLYAWQGGMIGGLGTANVLVGKANPSGKLTDTIACSIQDYPAYEHFGNPQKEVYTEDIFVGYRYFETFAKDKVLYPFGFGHSYTQFEITNSDFDFHYMIVTVSVNVKNVGSVAGKEVVQIYLNKPNGKLGNPSKVLVDYKKTKVLQPNETQTLIFTLNLEDFVSFDDTGITGKNQTSVLEEGKYTLFFGNSVASTQEAGSFTIEKNFIVKEHFNAMAPKQDFERLSTTDNTKIYGIEPTSAETQNSHRNKHLSSIQDENQKEFSENTKKIIAKLTDEDLFAIVRGEGMSSPKVTPGTASAFGGMNNHLASLGIPAGCCSDGPSGMRLDSGAEAFSLPNGTMQACTFNEQLITELYTLTGHEMVYNNVDILLGPGLNIHRFPLNGRNFEYFSEDPLLTGNMATAVIAGLHKAGVSGSLKHFCCNNQEFGRNTIDCVVSQRALREIYLKGFEIACKNGADVIMTTYGSVNGLWTAGNYDLNTLILRKEWNFSGIVMTDWWAKINSEYKEPNTTNFAQMVRSQNDLYMTCPDAAKNEHGDNLESELKSGNLSRAELERCAGNIIEFLSKSHAKKRLTNEDVKINVINNSGNVEENSNQKVDYICVTNENNLQAEYSLESVKTTKGTSFTFAVKADKVGLYELEIVAKAQGTELSQIPVGLRINGLTINGFTWNGTNGEYVSQKQNVWLLRKYSTLRLFFAENGLELKSLKITKAEEETN